MAFPSATLSFIVLLLATIQSRGDNVIINITDKRLAWSGPNRYHTKCGGVNFLMKNEVVLLNFTGEREPAVVVMFSVEYNVDSRHQHYD